MSDTTTNATEESGAQTVQGVQVDDQGRAVAEPEEPDQAEAVDEQTDPGDSTEPEETQEEPQESKQQDSKPEDGQLAWDEAKQKWAESKGLELNEQSEKAARMAWEAEKKMHQATQKAGELEKSTNEISDQVAEAQAEQTGENAEYLKRLQRMEVKTALTDFWSNNPEAREYEAKMVQVLKDKPYLAGDLDTLYVVAKSSNLDAVKKEGGQEALKSLASKQQAAVPAGNAVSSQTDVKDKITPENVDSLVAKNSQEWFEKNYDAINAAMAQ